MVGLEPAGDTDAAAFVIDALGRLGFETRSATSTFGDREITLCTYRLVAVARTDSEVVRGIRRGLAQRILDDNAPHARRPVHRSGLSRPTGRQLLDPLGAAQVGPSHSNDNGPW